MRLALVTSGRGGNARFLLRAMELGALPLIDSVFVLHGKNFLFMEEKSPVVRTVFIPQDFEDHDSLERSLNKIGPDLIVLNYDRIIPGKIVRAFQDKIVNLHYSLLPAHSGRWLGQISKELAASRPLMSGVTIHEVTNQVDAGPILAQAVFSIEQTDTEESLKTLAFRVGVFLTVAFLNSCSQPAGSRVNLTELSYGSRKMILVGRKKLVVPPLLMGTRLFDEFPV